MYSGRPTEADCYYLPTSGAVLAYMSQGMR